VKILFSIALMLISCTGFAQTGTPPVVKERGPDSLNISSKLPQGFTSVQRIPTFPGGEGAFGRYLSANIIYPQNARKNKIGGRVILTIMIETDGSVGEVKVVKSVDKEIDEEAIRVVKASPKWLPAIQNDKPVRVQTAIPINFSVK
jgi:protein TonB